jgi:hypothetical protein
VTTNSARTNRHDGTPALVVALATLAATDAEAQGLSQSYGPDGQVYSRRTLDSDYAPPNLPPDIIAPERPRVAPRQRKAAPPIAVLPLDPPVPEPIEPTPTTPAPAPMTLVEIKPHPLAEWCGQEANAKTPLCRNIGSSKMQR